MNTENEQAASVPTGYFQSVGEVVTTSGVNFLQNSAKSVRSTKRQPQTAYMIIRAGRPYFYETVNCWNPKTKTIRTTKKYLGTSLPRGYYLSEAGK